MNKKTEHDAVLEQALLSWQKKHDDYSFNIVKNKMGGMLKQVASKYYGSNLPKSIINSKLDNLLLKALNTWDKQKGAFSTHLYNTTQKMYRFVNAHQNVAFIPEHQTLQLGAFINTKHYLADKLGREPSLKEIAEELKIDLAEAERLNKVIVVENNIGDKEDYSWFHSKLEDPVVQVIYTSIPDDLKPIFEEMTGLNGNTPTSNVTEISKRTKIPYFQVRSRIKKLMKIMEQHYAKYSRAYSTT